MSSSVISEVPRGNLQGVGSYFRFDVVAGFLVFLIALPLCLGIALACGYPPLAGIYTAIIGAIVCSLLSNSELTIKGPAAGLIVIALGCIQDFGGDGAIGGFTGADLNAYRMALAVGVVAAILQIVFGLLRAGILGEFFPISAVHGMLAAIGIIIIAKQVPVALGVEVSGEPLELLRQIPNLVLEANPAIAAIGAVSILIMFLWPVLAKRVTAVRVVPAPLVVLLVAVPLGLAFDLLHPHSYFLQEHKYQLGEQYLVAMPDRMFGMFDELTFPDFSALALPKAWKWVFMFFVIGSLESLLSAKAIDMIDPWKRKTDLDRDMVAVGIANLCSALVGGLPMISEIVRSRANIDNGARTRFADMWHGVFLLVCVALMPTLLHLIPLSALAAMLVYTGYRLAHPTEFIHIFKIGREQLIIFTSTLVAVLATDLLIGITIGILTKFGIHLVNGVPLASMFKPFLAVTQLDENTCMISARHSAVFSNWIPFKLQIEQIGLVQRNNLVVDLSDVVLVDHSVMEKLGEMEREFNREGLGFQVVGLEFLQNTLSAHERAARKRGLASVRRITLIADPFLEERLQAELLNRGAAGLVSVLCRGMERRSVSNSSQAPKEQVRIEVVVTPSSCEAILYFLQKEVFPRYAVTACVETVEVIRTEQFSSNARETLMVMKLPEIRSAAGECMPADRVATEMLRDH